MYIARGIEARVRKILSSGLIAVVYGARQVGKTTLARRIMEDYKDSLYLNCDDSSVVMALLGKSAMELKSYIGAASLVVIDEGQRVDNIGLTVKLLHDSYPDIKILVTGSSSLDLANRVSEPLTGRSEEIILYPFSIDEVSANRFEADQYWKMLMLRGGYPAMWGLSADDAYFRLGNLANNYIYRDAFNAKVSFDNTTISNLLRLLAYQIGQEVSYTELATKLAVSKETVMRYIDLLEKAFIIFRRNQYRRNSRVEVGRLRKIYFVDLGIRNALIDNFKDLNIRDDVGLLWENFCAVERLKYFECQRRRIKSFYWRSKDQREIDIIEEEGDELRAFECKYNSKKTVKVPRSFASMYPDHNFTVLNPANFFDALHGKP